jgi:GT2 family glycosyltransferase
MTIVHQQNEGLIATCHRALEMVTETFVVRLDADDKMPINFLEVLYTALQGKPEHVGFAYSSAQLFGKDTGWIMAKPWSIARLAPENYIHVSSLMRTEMARDTGYFSDALQGGYEDWDFYLTLAENGFSGVFCPDTFLWYRQKDDGGRNVLPRDKARELRAQIEERHPKIYENSGIKLRIFVWKVLRRIRHWFGKA